MPNSGAKRLNYAGIATGLWAYVREIVARFQTGKRFFPQPPRSAMKSTRPPRLWIPGTIVGIKCPMRESDHSPPLSTEIENMGIHTSISTYTLPMCTELLIELKVASGYSCVSINM
jgi:hypothetical protein